MPIYQYTAINSQGKRQKGTEDALSEARLKQILKNQSLTVLSIKKDKKRRKESDPVDQFLGGVPLSDLMIFTKYLKMALNSGLLINEAVAMTIQQLKRNKLQAILKQSIKKVQTGNTLHDALYKYKKYFPSVYLNMLRIGEQSGSLEENLDYLEAFVGYQIKMKSTIKGAMMYPCLIFGALIGLCILLMTFVLPNILPVFESFDVDLPATTQFLIKLAKYSENNMMIVVSSPFVFVFGLIGIFKLPFLKPYIHFGLLYFPIISKPIRALQLSRICKTIGILIKSGVPIVEAVEITCEGTTNLVYQKSIDSSLRYIKNGEKLSTEIAKYPHLYPPMLYQMVAIGEKTESVEKVFLNLGDFFEEDAENFLKNLSSILEPMILIIIGIVVAVVVMSIITPIFSVTQNIGGSI